MIVPLILFCISLIAFLTAFLLPSFSDLILVAGPALLGSLYLIVVAWLRTRATASRPWLVIDGSNVMHWRDNVPRVETLREVLGRLANVDHRLFVIFDANVGYKLAGRYMNKHEMRKLMGMPVEQVFIVPKGQQADASILKMASRVSARIVSNDQYRDWAHSYPEAGREGYLIRGGYRNGKLWLDEFKTPAAPA